MKKLRGLGQASEEDAGNAGSDDSSGAASVFEDGAGQGKVSFFSKGAGVSIGDGAIEGF
jgi:hypothetical protein